MKFFKNYSVALLVTLFALPVLTGCRSAHPETNEYLYPLKLSAGNRYLVDQQGKPFFWAGDAGWSAVLQLNKEEIDYYLDNRKQKGFTVILVNLIDHKFGTNAPANIYNDPPFADKPFNSPNENYFMHADYFIREADERGMLVLLCPLYLGWEYGDEGWAQEVISADPEDLRKWGQFIGKRYSDDRNIIWCIGGDADPSPLKDKILECVSGILENDTIHLFTCHNRPELFPVDSWEGQDWMTINNVYSYSSSLYEQCKIAYDHEPVVPYFMIESAYENEHKVLPRQLRSEACWPLLCGGMGHIFGNCPVWHFGSTPAWCGISDWKAQLNNQGSESMDYVQRLFRSRPWHLLKPDFDHKILTDGYGEWRSADYVTAAVANDGTSIIAYLPAGRHVTVDLSAIRGNKARCWWYNPGNGNVTDNGIIPAEGLRQFNPPEDGDWILVIDDDGSHYPPPGSKTIF
jgi:hypothetical protein